MFSIIASTTSPVSAVNLRGPGVQPETDVRNDGAAYGATGGYDDYLAYLGELPEAARASSVDGIVEPGEVAHEIEANNHYLVMLGATRSIEYCMYLRRIQSAYGLDDRGQLRPDRSDRGGWPAGQSFPELLASERVRALNIPPHIRTEFINKFNEIQAEVSADPTRLAAYQANPFKYFEGLYNHFAYGILAEYLGEVVGLGADEGYALFDRLAELNAKLPEGSRLNLPEGVNYATFDPQAVLAQIKSLQADAGSLEPSQREALTEMTYVCMFISVKYLMALRTIQQKNRFGRFDDIGRNWPMTGSGRRASEVTWRAMVEKTRDAGLIDRDVAQNILGLIDDSRPVGKQFTWFSEAYMQNYGGAFNGYYTLISRDADGGYIDQLVRIQAMNERDLCSILTTVPSELTPETAVSFDELGFLGEVREKVIAENESLVTCLANLANSPVVIDRGDTVPWPRTKELWSNYIQRVYHVLGVELSDSDLARLDELFDAGARGEEIGITEEHMFILTKIVEEIRISGTRFNMSTYESQWTNIHGDPDMFVPDSVGHRRYRDNFRNTPVMQKMGIRIPLGIWRRPR